MEPTHDVSISSRPPPIIPAHSEAPQNSVPVPNDSAAPRKSPSQQRLETILAETDPELFEEFFGEEQNSAAQTQVADGIGNFIVQMAEDQTLRNCMEIAIVDDESQGSGSVREAKKKLNEFMNLEGRAQLAFKIHHERFPSAIWHCCRNVCFATLATDPLQFPVFNELLLIHGYVNRCQSAIDELIPVEERRCGVGTSTVAFVSESREQRETRSGVFHGSGREKALREFAKFILEVLPFLYGQADSPRGTARPLRKLCTAAICCLLGVSRNFLYNRKRIRSADSASEEDLTCLVDAAGLRLRQHRRNGDRRNYPLLQELQQFNCGCDLPCYAELPQLTLVSEYEEFVKLSAQMRPRHKENRFLLDRMFCPLTNTTTRVCNKAIYSLYTVSEALVADVRRALDMLCAGSTKQKRRLLSDGTLRYQYHREHPLNRYPDAIREKIENHLDMVLRTDPAGSTGDSVCRVYSPEINTQEKLRKLLRKVLDADDSVNSEVSASTLQRMVNDYLKRRNYSAISFAQSDHNACPNCKTLQYAILQYHHEAVFMKRDFQEVTRGPRPFQESLQKRVDDLEEAIKAKNFQEQECVDEMKGPSVSGHNSRDGRIREFVKNLRDHFRNVERKYHDVHRKRRQAIPLGTPACVQWNTFPDHACITHQDDMSKLDLPHFVVSASSDITRWRFDVNAHVSSVTNDGIVFSHEQGTGAKNASSIIEEVLLSHLLRCRGESIKILVSDNAAVGKNWLTTVALPQYIVDQGLAEIVLIVFLENNHGKWLADKLFGQFQSRRRRSVLLGIDDMLSGFEEINRRSGKVSGFAINPLSSIDFASVFESLGYETKPSSNFGFVRRNIHFAGACAAGAKERLPVDLQELLVCALPDDAGMVRLSTEPPGPLAQSELSYEDRYFDVPAARLNRETVEGEMRGGAINSDDGLDVPLVVALDHPYALNGSGVVSTRTAVHVGYNGIMFRGTRACPELKDTSKSFVRQAWPRGLLERTATAGHDRVGPGEPVPESEGLKCAPLNWVGRRPVRDFCSSDEDSRACYPPRNLLNALYRKPPRAAYRWVPTATYIEPPFPIREGTAACSAMRNLAAEHNDIGKTVNVLDALRTIFKEMGGRDGVTDTWLQRRATMPTRAALERYRYELKIDMERESGRPRAPRTIRQVFKQNEKVLEDVAKMLKDHSATGAVLRTLTTKTLAKLFEEAEKTPGALDRFYLLAEKDQERYARELLVFKRKEGQFDRDNGCLSLPIHVSTSLAEQMLGIRNMCS